MKKKIIGILIILLLVMSQVSGCASGSKGSQTETKEMDYGSSDSNNYNVVAQEESISQDKVNSGKLDTNDSVIKRGVLANISNNKIIYRGKISLETEEFDVTISKIEETIAKSGAYIQNSSINGRGYDQGDPKYANFQIRVPMDRFENMKKDAENWGTVNHESQNTEDVTEYYYDVEARLETLRIQEERLLDLLKKADKMEDILSLERELQNIRYTIESNTGSLRKMDNLIDYSTLSVDVYEVKQVKVIPKNFGQQVSETMGNSLESFAELLKSMVLALLYLLPYLIIGCIALYLIKKKNIKIPKIKIPGKRDKQNPLTK